MDMISKVVIVVLMVVARVIVCGGILASAGLAVFSLVAQDCLIGSLFFCVWIL